MNLFNIKKGDVVSITGAGGKTSLMFFLANKLKDLGSVLIATTTKIFVPNNNLIFISPEEIENFSPQDNFIHIFSPEIIQGKIQSAQSEDLENLRKRGFHYILIEADGSASKPLKGWKENEPVIPSITTKTIAVIDITCIGKEKSNNTVHRLPLYEAQFQSESKNISLNDIVHYIDSNLFFKNYLGDNYLFFNKIHSLTDFQQLFNVVNSIKKSSNIYFGSVLDENIYPFKSITPVVLAAGFSKRFQGKKLESQLRNKTIIEHTLESFNNIIFREKIIVGREFNFQNLAKKKSFIYLENPLAHLGQSQSVVLGALNSSSQGVMFIPGDMPFLKESNLLKIIWEFQKNNEIIVPFIDEKPCAPVLFPKRYTPELSKLKGDTGGREIIKSNPFIKCYFYNSYEFLDIDTQDELKKLEILED